MSVNFSQLTSRKSPIRFSQIQAGPPRVIQGCLTALKRRDRAVVLTAPTRAERHAVLSDVGHRAGAEYTRIVHLHGDECGRSLETLLRAEGLAFARETTFLPVPWPGSDSVLVIIDEAELVPQATLAALAMLCVAATGAAVQVVLAGSPALIPMLCQPECHAIWREIRMTLMLEEPAPGARFSGLNSLMAGVVHCGTTPRYLH